MMLQSGIDPKQTTVAECAAWLSRLNDMADDAEDGEQTDGVW